MMEETLFKDIHLNYCFVIENNIIEEVINENIANDFKDLQMYEVSNTGSEKN